MMLSVRLVAGTKLASINQNVLVTEKHKKKFDADDLKKDLVF